ncbi:male sterility protein-domain-containing protein [Phycomyces nitens]|nr:male sterility protein-domain-containing protein [Phycomyces nitens]
MALDHLNGELASSWDQEKQPEVSHAVEERPVSVTIVNPEGIDSQPIMDDESTLETNTIDEDSNGVSTQASSIHDSAPTSPKDKERSNELEAELKAQGTPPTPIPAIADPSSQPLQGDEPSRFDLNALQNVLPEFAGPVSRFYQHKNILLTGATGFVGKAVLWKLLQAFGPNIGKIYVLIRNGSNKRSKIGRPTDRIRNEILSNKAFLSLKRSIGVDLFDAIIKEKIIPIAGDIISPDLSITEEDREMITRDVNVVIHCAATLDYHERLDLSLETNTLGTLRLMDLADECKNMQAFIHMSLAYLNANLPDGNIQERVYPMELGDPEELLKEIVGLELQDIPKTTQRILGYYPNTYTFTKALTEHLILKRVDYNRLEEVQGGKAQWPVAIVRATQVGGGAYEPLPGWVDGVTGANGAIVLIGNGIQVLQPDIGDIKADIVPVDYLARIVIGSAAYVQPPGTKFLLPYNEIIANNAPVGNANIPHVQYFPTIYQVSATNIDSVNWRKVYESTRHYWIRTTKVALPTAKEHFVSNKTFFKAKIFMRNHLHQSFTSIASINTNISNGNTGNRSELSLAIRAMELATRVVEANQPFIRHRWQFENQNVKGMHSFLDDDYIFSLNGYQNMNWERYIMNYSYGAHIYITQGPAGSRALTVPLQWDCALYSKFSNAKNSIIDRQIESVIFSASDIEKRTERMLAQIVSSLEKPDYEPRDKKKIDEWVNDFDASLDDWCHDDSEILKDGATTADLGRWAVSVGEDDQSLKVIVLNDKRVGNSIRQIIDTSGVPQQTVVGEAFKVLQRMKERTQLAYVWFAGAFLDSLFKNLFSSVRIKEGDLLKMKESIKGKNVVYVPVSKTILDQLLVWYICLRYHLPVPAIVCDEALALLGPISDILRIAGAYFVRRDQSTRSPLNTAVAAAYTEALLHDHGALSMLIEKARSRTGRLQTVYKDGVLDMVIEATLERNQTKPSSRQSTQLQAQYQAAYDNGSSSSLVSKDTMFVPINITYEKVPELRTLIDQVLDQKPRASTVSNSRLSAPSNFLRPSASFSGRASNKENRATDQGKYGRVYIGIGETVDLKKKVQEAHSAFDKDGTVDMDEKHPYSTDYVAKIIQKHQHRAAIVSPVSLVAAAVLFGRATNGLPIGKIYEYVEWLREEIIEKGILLDWQAEEDVETVVSYALNLLDAKTNIIIDGKRVTEYTNVRVMDHADNIMDLSYMANQLIEILLPEAFFAVVYLSTGPKRVSNDDLFKQFTFLVHLFKDEFVYPWDKEQEFYRLLEWYTKKGILTLVEGDNIYDKSLTMDSDHTVYTQICLIASFLYPTLDAYWITSCSLSALRDLPYIPRKVVPILSQWIAAHLISGRRTIYREVLSTEASQNAVDNFLVIGFIDAVHPKTKLSPDAQILLLELGVTTNEDLVMVSNRENMSTESESDLKHANAHEHPDSLSHLKDIAALCYEIERYRFGADAQNKNQRQDAHVFDKCQNQIRSILRAEESYATQHGMELIRDEDQMIQLVYSLKAASNEPLPEEGASFNPRRVSEVYNLKP